MIGLGAMGSALAKAMLSAGLKVTVWNRTPERSAPLGAAGAVVANSAAEAISASPLVLTCLLNYRVTREALAPAAAAGLLRDRDLINSASATPDEAEEFQSWATNAGARYLDAKLMTYPLHVGQPDTLIYYSGDRQVFEGARQPIGSIAGCNEFLGSSAGSAAVIYQAVWGYYYAALYGFMESAAFARRSGIAVADLLPHVQRAGGDLSWHLQDVTRRVSEGDYGGEQAELVTYVDGLSATLDSFIAAGVDSKVLRSIVDLTIATSGSGAEHEDVAAVVRYLSRDPG
jgi:3-hydroxyisobutyrate dehydrogenase-like beta-hydroxyacid dehydrogenase